MNLLDWLSWQVIRIAALLQAMIADLMLRFSNDTSLRSRIKLMQVAISGWHIWNSDPEGIPKEAGERLLIQGRFVVLLIAGIYIFAFIKTLIKEVTG